MLGRKTTKVSFATLATLHGTREAAPDTHASAWVNRSKLVSVLLACVTPVYALILLAGQHRNIGIDSFGLTFNSMLDHLLRGEWDVDPQVIGQEAFIHNGKTYAYFGPVPALLRLPMTLLPNWRTLHVEMVSCLCAMLLGAGAQVYALLTLLARLERTTFRALAAPLVAVSLLSGPAVTLGAKGPMVYHEPMLWAWACVMVFVSISLIGLARNRTFTGAECCTMSICAGLCLLTRATTGAGLYAATGLLLLREILLHVRHRSGARISLPNWIYGSVVILTAFLVAAAVVNEGRWQNPLQFADLRDQIFQIRLHPDRAFRLQRYSLFDPARIGIGLLYYIAPVWNASLNHIVPLEAFLAERFDGLERPASSFIVTDPLWCGFAAYGAVLLVQRRAPAGAAALVAGLAVAPSLMLTAWYLAFRYRVDFAPLLFTLACIGLAPWAASLSGLRLTRARMLVAGLSVLQITGTAVTSVAYSRTGLGPTETYSTLMLFKQVQGGPRK